MASTLVTTLLFLYMYSPKSPYAQTMQSMQAMQTLTNMKCSGIDACKGQIRRCVAGGTCDVLCSGKAACMDSQIIGTDATKVNIICNGEDTCKGLTVSCGTGDCVMTCQSGINVCVNLIVEATQGYTRSFQCYDMNGLSCPNNVKMLAFTAMPTYPTPEPTLKPTPSPTHGPTLKPTPSPIWRPTQRSTNFLPQPPTLPASIPRVNVVRAAPCPGYQVRDTVTNTCSCPERAPNGLMFPRCQPPLMRNSVTCDCEMPVLSNAIAATCGAWSEWGTFNNQAIRYQVTMPYYGDMFFSLNFNGFTLSSIRAYNKLNPNTDLAKTIAPGVNYIYVPKLPANTQVIFEVTGVGKGLFASFTHCESKPLPPTSRPTSPPTPPSCPGPLIRNTITNICECPTRTPGGLFLPVCTSPFVQNPVTCDCVMPPTTSKPTSPPTNRPTLSPTVPPTMITFSPTKTPTNKPTTLPPTNHPSNIPTLSPTMRPTNFPTNKPSNIPTTSPTMRPTTPSPTQPGRVECGSKTTGDFNGELMVFTVQIPFMGDVSFYITGMDVTKIKAFDEFNPITPIIETPVPGVTSLTVSDLTANALTVFVVEGTGKSPYQCMIHCGAIQAPHFVQDAVISTKEPVTAPKPTLNPTTSAPVTILTPAPTDFGHILCGDLPLSGTLTPPQPVIANVRIPKDGALTLSVITSHQARITSITAYGLLQPFTPIFAETTSSTLTIPDLPKNADLTFYIDASGNGVYVISTTCEYTRSPPTNAPTKIPTQNPTTFIPATTTTTSPGSSLLRCGRPKIGNFNQQELEFMFQVPFGFDVPDLVFTITGVTPISIEAYSSFNPSGLLALSTTNSLAISNAIPNTYLAFIVNSNSRGPFSVTLNCRSKALRNTPTKMPSMSPTVPSLPPTKYPSATPTFKPTNMPSATPSAAPTRSPPLLCGDTISGDFIGPKMEFRVLMQFEGDLSFSITGVNVNVVSIKAYNSLNLNRLIRKTPIMGINTLSVFDQEINTEMLFVVEATGDSTFNVMTHCKSASPTISPTEHPSVSPTLSPTQFLPIGCGTTTSGDFFGSDRAFAVMMPYDADLSFRIMGITVLSIRAYNALNPNRIISRTPLAGINGLSLYGLQANSEIIFQVKSTGGGTFELMTTCTSMNPTKAPSVNPSVSPTLSPTPFLAMQCPGIMKGDFTGSEMRFGVMVPHDGDLRFFVTGVNTLSIKAYNALNITHVITRTTMAGINSLQLFNLARNSEIIFIVEGTADSAAGYNVMTSCESAEPTKDPTVEPTRNPIHPPTISPTNYPTTASPTMPPDMTCNVPLSGDFNGEKILFNVNIPFNGIISFYISGFTVTSIKAFNIHWPNAAISQTPAIGINSLSVTDLMGNTDIRFEVEGQGKSKFTAIAQCDAGPGNAKTKSVVPDTNDLRKDVQGVDVDNYGVHEKSTIMVIGYLLLAFILCNVTIFCCYYRIKYKKKNNPMQVIHE